jgi:hypothetical protein
MTIQHNTVQNMDVVQNTSAVRWIST